jgi:hypothetical protein
MIKSKGNLLLALVSGDNGTEKDTKATLKNLYMQRMYIKIKNLMQISLKSKERFYIICDVLNRKIKRMDQKRFQIPMHISGSGKIMSRKKLKSKKRSLNLLEKKF